MATKKNFKFRTKKQQRQRGTRSRNPRTPYGEMSGMGTQSNKCVVSGDVWYSYSDGQNQIYQSGWTHTFQQPCSQISEGSVNNYLQSQYSLACNDQGTTGYCTGNCYNIVGSICSSCQISQNGQNCFCPPGINICTFSSQCQLHPGTPSTNCVISNMTTYGPPTGGW